MITNRCNHNSDELLYEENLELHIDVAPNRAYQDDVVELNIGGGGGSTPGTTNYNDLYNKPTINGITLRGDVVLNIPHYIAGNNITISENGVIAAVDTIYTLPAATPTTLGGIKIGENLSYTDNVLSLTKQNVIDALGYEPGTGSGGGSIGDIPLADAFTNGLMKASDFIKLSQFDTASKYAKKTDITNMMTYGGTTVSLPTLGTMGQVYYNLADNYAYIYAGSWYPMAPKAFNKVQIGINALNASLSQTLTINAGSNITITPNVTNNSITISSTGGGGTNTVVTHHSNGLMIAEDKIKLDAMPAFSGFASPIEIIDELVTIPVASLGNTGLVKSSSAQNKITVGFDGTMTVNTITVDKLVTGPNEAKIPTSLIEPFSAAGGLTVDEENQIIHANAPVEPSDIMAFRKIAYDEYGHITDSVTVSASDLGVYDIFTNTEADFGVVPTIGDSEVSVLVSDGHWYDTLILYGGTSVQGV